MRDKNELDEKLIFLEEKRLTYSRWETQMYDILKWINEEKSARTHLKGLANKMAEELDQIRETTSPLLTIGSNSSSMTTAGTSLGHNTVSKLPITKEWPPLLKPCPDQTRYLKSFLGLETWSISKIKAYGNSTITNIITKRN